MRIKNSVLVILLAMLLLGFGGEPSLGAEDKGKSSRYGGNEKGELRRRVLTVRKAMQT